MAAQAVTVELPDEVIEAVGSVDAAAAKAREALVMALLRDATFSQGQAARFLGVTRGDVLDLMVRY